MAAGIELRVSTEGIAEVLRSQEVGDAVEALAADVAARVAEYDDDAEGEVRPYLYDRRAATVVFVHPKSMALEVRDGVLTRAAAAAGLEVRSRR